MVLLRKIIEKDEKKYVVNYVTFKNEDKTKELIEKYLKRITVGPVSKTREKTIFIRINNFFENQGELTVNGAIAEFFTHVVLNDINFEQGSLFFNLEENSIKKGFDGLYLKDDNFWLVESKSSKQETKTHKDNIRDAINDLSNKIVKGVDNNPWENAKSHYIVVFGHDKSNFIDKISLLADNYYEKIYAEENDFNIIPASTLFFETTTKFDEDFMVSQASKYKDVIFICIDNTLKKWFKDYVKESAI